MRNFSCDIIIHELLHLFLGVRLFIIQVVFQEHLFEDLTKLRILNAKYYIPPSDYTYKDFHNK